VGGRVTVTAERIGEPGDRLTFAVTATDQDGQVVATGEIERAVVTRTDFG
jgi:fluoroacetyl-CoA thioesterase